MFALARLSDARRVRDDPIKALKAASTRLPPGAAFSGLTAAWLHGLDVEPCNPIQATAPASAGISTRAGMRLRRCRLSKEDVVTVRGLPATSMLATLRDVALRLSLTEALVIADMALHARLIKEAELSSAARDSSHGVRKMRRLIKYVAPSSESPMETRLRWSWCWPGCPFLRCRQQSVKEIVF